MDCLYRKLVHSLRTLFALCLCFHLQPILGDEWMQFIDLEDFLDAPWEEGELLDRDWDFIHGDILSPLGAIGSCNCPRPPQGHPGPQGPADPAATSLLDHLYGALTPSEGRKRS